MLASVDCLHAFVLPATVLLCGMCLCVSPSPSTPRFVLSPSLFLPLLFSLSLYLAPGFRKAFECMFVSVSLIVSRPVWMLVSLVDVTAGTPIPAKGTLSTKAVRN